MDFACSSSVLRHVSRRWKRPGYEVSNVRARVEPREPVPPVMIIVLCGAIFAFKIVEGEVLGMGASSMN